MENTEEIYTDFARVYDELMDNTPYEMWCNRLDQLIASYGVSRPTRDAEGILDSERCPSCGVSELWWIWAAAPAL